MSELWRHPPVPILELLAWVYGWMLLWTVACVTIPALRRPEAKSLREAGLGWWPSTLIGGVAVLGGRFVALLVFAGVSAWTLREFLRLIRDELRTDVSRVAPIEIAAFAAIPVHYAALATHHAELFWLAGLLWIFAVLPFVWAMTRGPAGMLRVVPKIQFGLVLTVVAISFVPRIILVHAPSWPVGGAGLATLLLTSVMVGDASQFAFGKTLGRHRLAPVISPKKTWEGFLGGALFAAFIAALITPGLTPYPRFVGALLGAACCTVGLLGDLLVSAIKRDVGVKDTGQVIPGQGGVLDRCDSLLLAAPLFYFLVTSWRL